MHLVEASSHSLMSHDGKILSGLFAELGTFNQNGRRYPDDIYEQAYEELIPKIKERRLLGELDHPMDYDEIRLSNVSHAITECEMLEEGGIKKIYGTVELLDTPSGMIAQSLVKAGIPLGISSRGLGSTKQVRDGAEVTQLKLITYDLVAEPSFSAAILSPDKSKELEDSLQYIENNLPLNESVESQSVRNMIKSIRESLISRDTVPVDEVNINQMELDSLKSLVEQKQETILADTESLIESRKEIKTLRESLSEAENKYKHLLKNMFKLQDSYNKLKEGTPTEEDTSELREEILTLQKQLAVEKRGMSYSQVADLLESANTEEEIESRLNSLSSVGKKHQTSLVLDESILTKNPSSRSGKKGQFNRLASIISNV